MKNEFTLAFNEVLEDKQLPKDVIINALESAMVSAYKKVVNAPPSQIVIAKVDPDTGRVIVFAQKEVVESVFSPDTEVLISEAKLVTPTCEIGDLVTVESTPPNFGRVAAQTARQVIQQRIRDAERNAQKVHFERQLGEIISGVVQASNAQSTTIGLDLKAEGIMPAAQRIPGERFRIHDRVRTIIMEIKETNRGPQIILSRAHRNFLRRLLENEVPEIYHGIVEIRSISREPGQRAKVAVSATQPGIDPVGACVGIRGVRIQSIVKELHDEKIDIIEWSADPVIYISKAISPARVTGVYVNELKNTATVVVMEDQLSLAIGRDGQNARLAAKLTNWKIDIKSVIEAATDTIVALQNEASLQATAELEKEASVLVNNILDKKAEGKPLTPEEYTTLSSFVERVERRTLERNIAQQAEIQARLAAAREGVPAAAFEQDLDILGLPEHVFNTVTGDEIYNVGELIVTIRSNPDRLRNLPGINVRNIALIEQAIQTYLAPAPQVTEQPAEQPVAEVATEEPAQATEPVAEAEIETGPELSFEEMFKVRPEAVTLSAEEEEKLERKGKKGKKSVEYEFDEERGEVVGKKKHKRGDEGFTVDWE